MKPGNLCLQGAKSGEVSKDEGGTLILCRALTEYFFCSAKQKG